MKASSDSDADHDCMRDSSDIVFKFGATEFVCLRGRKVIWCDVAAGFGTGFLASFATPLFGVSSVAASEVDGGVSDFGGRPNLGRSMGVIPSAMNAGLALFQECNSSLSFPDL